MPKRSRVKQMSKEAIALKRMRVARDLSLRKASKVLGVSATSINHCENGRAVINDSHIENFLKRLNYSREDWNLYLKGDSKSEDLRGKCILLLKGASPSNLEFILKMLQNL